MTSGFVTAMGYGPPAVPVNGETWYDVLTMTMKVFNNGDWFEVLSQPHSRIYTTIEAIDDPTPLEIVYSYFNRYFNENKDPNVMNDVEDYRFIYAITQYIDELSSPLTPEGYKQLYNRVRRFIIQNEIKDLNNTEENIIILFKLAVLK